MYFAVPENVSPIGLTVDLGCNAFQFLDNPMIRSNTYIFQIQGLKSKLS
jgi:hypothetical protein